MLVRLQLLPDELAISYAGALCRVNGVRGDTALYRLLERWWTASVASAPADSRTALLAASAGVPLEFLVRHHTLLPLRRGVAAWNAELPHGMAMHRRLANGALNAILHSGGRLCVDCVAADQQDFGRSYWRRQHQLPGLYWCPKHRRGLHQVSGDKAFEQCPAAHIATAQEYDYDWVKTQWEDPAVQNYFGAVDMFLDSPTPFAPGIVRDALRLRAKPLGYQTHPGRGRVSPNTLRVLSDDIHKRFPSAWLARTFPGLKPKPEARQLQCKVDGVLWLGAEAMSTPGYALVASMLFDSSAEFMHAVAQVRAGVPKAIRGRAVQKAAAAAL
jgi:TniQ